MLCHKLKKKSPIENHASKAGLGEIVVLCICCEHTQNAFALSRSTFLVISLNSCKEWRLHKVLEKILYLLQVDEEHGKELLRREHGGLHFGAILLVLQLNVNATARSLLHDERNFVLESLDALLRPPGTWTKPCMRKSNAKFVCAR